MTALLIPWKNLRTGESGYVWMNENDDCISGDFATRGEALKHRPEGHICCDDGYHRI